MAEDLFDVVRAEPEGASAAKAPAPDAPAGENETTPDGPSDVVLRLHVQPGAGRAAVVGRHGDALHVRVAPPPADGRANSAVLDLVAELLGVQRAELELVGGERSREKRVRVHGLEPALVDRRLDEAIDQAGLSSGGRGRGRPGRPGH